MAAPNKPKGKGLNIRIEPKRPIVLIVNGKRVEIWHRRRNWCRIDAPPEVRFEPNQEPGEKS